MAALVARMPSWISLIVDRNALDLNRPGGGSNISQEPLPTSADLVRAHDEGVAQARASLQRATDQVVSVMRYTTSPARKGRIAAGSSFDTEAQKSVTSPQDGRGIR